MRAKAIAAILATAAALIALALPAGAAAAHYYKQPGSVMAEIEGSATNGFHFLFLGLDTGSQIFSVSKGVGADGWQSLSLVAPSFHKSAAAEIGRIDASFGKLGHFRGRFVATSSKTRQPSSRCTGEPSTTEKGYFIGSFDFHGERGFATIHAEREQGTVSRIGATRCVAAPQGHHPSRPTKQEEKKGEGEFRLVAGDGKARVLLEANREESPREMHSAPTSYVATMTGGRAGKFLISRTAGLFSIAPEDPSTFQVPNLAEPLAEATLSPAAPFSGSAAFHLETPTTASWTGDLAVEFPGLGKVPLTGAKISAGLCQGRSHCTKTLPKTLQPVLEGGGSGRTVAFEAQFIH